MFFDSCRAINSPVVVVIMTLSFFTYNITRPYPFRWFTPVAFVGGFSLFALFTVLNLITCGYYLNVEYSENPNATISDGPWFKNWPSYFAGKMKATCEPITLPVGTQFFTNHTGLIYTLANVVDPSGNSNNTLSPSLTYLNNPFENCQISLVEIEMEAADRTGWQFATTQWGEIVRGFITCSISNSAGVTSFNLTVEYDFLPKSMAGFNQGTFKFLRTDEEHSASLWWGESLLSMYWQQVSYTMQSIRDNDILHNAETLRKGSVELTPSLSENDISKLDFFDLNYRFIKDTTDEIIFNQDINPSIAQWNETNQYPNIWIQADSLGKSLYSVALADLGQNDPTILTSVTTLDFYTQDFPEIISKAGPNAPPRPATNSYVAMGSFTGPLETSPAVISQKYQCQVPRRKAMGTLLMALLLANIVLMQTSWSIFTFVTSLYVQRSEASANYCQGCAAKKDHPLLDLSSQGQRLIRPSMNRLPGDSGYTSLGDTAMRGEWEDASPATPASHDIYADEGALVQRSPIRRKPVLIRT